MVDDYGPPHESDDITHFGWEFRDGIPVAVIAQCDPAPTQLIDAIKCECKACLAAADSLAVL